MGKQKILHVINWIGLRGSEKTCLNFAKSCDEFDHIFIARTPGLPETQAEFEAVGEVIIDTEIGSGGYFNYAFINDKFLDEKGVDLVVVYLPGDDLPPYVKDINKPVVLHVLCAKECRFDTKYLDAVTVPSPYAATLNPHLNPEWVYPTVEKLEPTKSKSDLLLEYFGEDDPNCFLVSRVGSIENVKHVEDFLAVAKHFQHVENMYFVFAGVGEPNYIDRLVTRYVKDTPNLKYLGVISEQEKSDLNAASDVCLYPTEFEAFGYSLAEPMSHGTPVVTYNESACPETIGEGGIAVEFNNLEALAKSLVDLITRPLLRKKLAIAAKERWESSFAPGKYTEKVVEIYRRVLDATS